jgi:hypothetical protein
LLRRTTRAERRRGEMIAHRKATVGLATGTAGKGRPALGGDIVSPPKNDRPTLAEAGIDKNLAHRARRRQHRGDQRRPQPCGRGVDLGEMPRPVSLYRS